MLEDAADGAAGHESRQQEVERQRDPHGEDVERESAEEEAHGSLVMHVRKRGGGRPPVAVRRPHGGAFWLTSLPGLAAGADLRE